MTTYTIRTNKYEADQITRGNKMYVLRSDNIEYRIGGVVNFLVIEGKKPAKHDIDGQKYMITTIERGDPIRDGVILLGVKRIG